MATDYELFYRENKRGLGEPTKEFVDFFNSYKHERMKVLDVGCGQGRDALLIARLGHSVTAIDLSVTGIQDLQADAAAEGLIINTEVIDIRHYDPKDYFDVIVIDRTLHMLDSHERTNVLKKLLQATSYGAHVLIADERSNIPDFIAVIDEPKWRWTTTLKRKGYLFLHREIVY